MNFFSIFFVIFALQNFISQTKFLRFIFFQISTKQVLFRNLIIENCFYLYFQNIFYNKNKEVNFRQVNFSFVGVTERKKSCDSRRQTYSIYFWQVMF